MHTYHIQQNDLKNSDIQEVFLIHETKYIDLLHFCFQNSSSTPFHNLNKIKHLNNSTEKYT